MDENSANNNTLIARIEQLEHERDDLHKDIEQLCMQQAGPSYLGVATRMHFQRTAALEQEIDNLKNKLAVCTRDNLNLQEELSEAYRIKGQLADLHNEEVSKNVELEKQIKFFHGCIAAAFAERDRSLMEAEKAKEKEELASQNLNNLQKRAEELTADCLEETAHSVKLQHDLSKQEEQNKTFMKVFDKFYQFRQHIFRGYDYEEMSWDDKCACLLRDLMGESLPLNTKQSDLEAELDMLRNSVNNLQYKLRVGLDIEKHLKKRISELEKKLIFYQEKIKNGISALFLSHSQDRVHIVKLLDEGKSQIKSIIDMVGERTEQLNMNMQQYLGSSRIGMKMVESECRDVYISPDAESSLSAERNDPGSPSTTAVEMPNTSETLAIALKEKVSTLLLLSQQEERHLLERNVNASLQKKVEELQRNLLQVTNEKVKALMDLAQLKQGYRLLQEQPGHGTKQESLLGDSVDKRITTHEGDGKLNRLLKKSYLGRWASTVDFSAHSEGGGSFSQRSTASLDLARMKIENAALKESMECMEQLIYSIERLRLSLVKVKESAACGGSSVALERIITEANLVKTAIGSSTGISRSGYEDGNGGERGWKLDVVSSAGFEMVELLLLAARILKDEEGSRDEG